MIMLLSFCDCGRIRDSDRSCEKYACIFIKMIKNRHIFMISGQVARQQRLLYNDTHQEL
jgi:hypothetical protein